MKKYQSKLCTKNDYKGWIRDKRQLSEYTESNPDTGRLDPVEILKHREMQWGRSQTGPYFLPWNLPAQSTGYA